MISVNREKRKTISKVLFLFLYNYIIIINLRVDSSLKGKLSHWFLGRLAQIGMEEECKSKWPPGVESWAMMATGRLCNVMWFVYSVCLLPVFVFFFFSHGAVRI